MHNCIALFGYAYSSTENNLKTITRRQTPIVLLTLVSLLVFTGCSQKPTSEEIAAQVKAAIETEKAKEQISAASAPVAASVVAPAAEAAPQHKSTTTVHKATTQSHKTTTQTTPSELDTKADPVPTPVPACNNCGVVVSINMIEQKGKGSGLGVIAGGVAGGLLGNQVGQGTGKEVATLAGAVGGAIAGHKIEQNIKKTIVVDVAVQMTSGEVRILRHETDPGVVAGDKVKIEDDHVVRQ